MAGLWRALFAEADDEGASASRARGRRLNSEAEIRTSSPTALDRFHASMLLAVPRQGSGPHRHRPTAVAILIDLQPTPTATTEGQ